MFDLADAWTIDSSAQKNGICNIRAAAAVVAAVALISKTNNDDRNGHTDVAIWSMFANGNTHTCANISQFELLMTDALAAQGVDKMNIYTHTSRIHVCTYSSC